MESFDDRARFIRAQTVLTEVPFVPEIRLHTATDLAPIWRATQARLSDLGVDVPFWCVPWAGGQALARWVLDHPEAVRGLRVVDFGTGSGLVAIACARAGARSVRAFDTDPLAAVACALNAEANDVAVDVVCVDVVGHDARTLDADIVLAGDIWYERAASKAFSPWLSELARAGVRVVTGDPSRSYVPSDLVELARYDVLTYADLEATPVCLTRVLEVPRRLLWPLASAHELKDASMITYEEAKTLALARLAKDSPTLDLVIQDEQTIVKHYGWIVFYCTREYAETGDFLYMLGGGGPLVVRHNGRTDQLEGRMAAEPTIAEWERKNGLKG